jgi:hypothetical protein
MARTAAAGPRRDPDTCVADGDFDLVAQVASVRALAVLGILDRVVR